MLIDIFGSWWFISLIGACIGLVIGLICVDFKQASGVIHVTQGEEKDQYLFEFNIPPEDIPKMKRIIFKVQIEQSKNLQST